MADLKTYIALQKGYADDRIVEEGETFTTSAPEGDWMQPLDKSGNPVEKKPKPKAKASPDAAAVEKLLDEAAKRADEAEKLLDEAAKRADEAEKLLDEAAKRADEAEKARDAALAELAALKTK